MTESESKAHIFTGQPGGGVLKVELKIAPAVEPVWSSLVVPVLPIDPVDPLPTPPKRGKQKTGETLERETHIRKVFTEVGKVNDLYCRKLDAALLEAGISPSTRASWRTSSYHCPDSYHEAWCLSDAAERNYWKGQIRNERKRAIK